MGLSKVFEKYVESSPVAVMTRALMECALEPKALDALFRDHAERQYEKQVLFSSLVDLMAPVVCGMHPSVHKAYKAMRQQIPVTLTALYGKLNGVEIGTSQALVAQSAERLRPVVDALGTPGERWLRGHRIKALDGNHLASTERRLEVLRDCAAGPLPGQSLAVLEPETGLAMQMVGCEDGHAQERSLLQPVLAAVQPKDVYIADRNFCTLGFLFGVAMPIAADAAESLRDCRGDPHRRPRNERGARRPAVVLIPNHACHATCQIAFTLGTTCGLDSIPQSQALSQGHSPAHSVPRYSACVPSSTSGPRVTP
jgi:hypothetical protein